MDVFKTIFEHYWGTDAERDGPVATEYSAIVA
jgi:hypothetical protein